MVNPKPLFSIRELVIPWLRKGNKPDVYIDSKDKNGVEIYEGDRVRWYTWDGYMGTETVVFRDGYFYPTPAKLQELGTGNRFDESRGVEVIGNIYESPELQEVE